ncbi:MAG: hypothetical protein methR_P0175 [Methyloprofundus sp.]|nr:MAG: hypothetical protein methR_P0175 [Methyloprofundus sp.]
MKKTLIGALVVIPSLWAGMTWVASNKTEATFDAMLAQSQQKITETVPLLSMEKQAFTKGFISSTAKSIIHLDPEIFELEEPVQITLDHSIYHGPLMLTSDGIKLGTSYIITTLDQEPLEAKTKQAIALIFANEQPFISSTQTNFDGSINEAIDIPTINIDSVALDNIFTPTKQSDTHFKLNLAGISSHFSTDMTTSYLNGLITLGILSVTGTNDQEEFSIQSSASNIQFDIDELYHNSMLSGSVELSNPEILLSNAASNISLKGLSIKSLATKQNGFYSQASTIDINKLLIRKDDSAVIFPESKLLMSFNLKGLEQAATKRLIDIGQDINQTLVSSLNSNDSEQAEQQLKTSAGNYLSAVNDLITPAFASNNSIELSNAQGKAGIYLDLNYASSRQLIELKTLKELIIAIAAELKINIDKGIVADTELEQLLNSPMAHNYIKSSNDAYVATAVLKSGQLHLNDKPIPILDMLGTAGDEPLNWEELLQ